MPIEAYHRPDSLEKALELTDEHRSSLEVISGGTITMAMINDGHLVPSRVLDLREAGLDGIDTNEEEVTLGATLTFTEVIEQIDIPLLQEAASHSGSWAVRNTGTVSGNLFAPPPLGDFAVALLALDSVVELQKQGNERSVPLAEFYTGPQETVLEPDELVTGIRVPAVQGDTAYTKLTRNQEPAPPVVTVAVNIERENEVVSRARLGLNGAGPHPIRATGAEAILEGSTFDAEHIEQAANTAAEQAEPPTDALASEWYRRKMITQYVGDVLTDMQEGAT